jgi:hypothetical protein
MKIPRRLSSPYVLYWTLNHILETFTPIKKRVEDAVDLETENPIPRSPHRFSFFEEIPEWISCAELGIPDTYCACYSLEQVELNDGLIISAAQRAMDWINTKVLGNSPCAELQVEKLTAGAVMDKTRKGQDWSSGHDKVLRYIVGFLANPGQILVEAEVNYFTGNKSFGSNPNVQRASKINQEHVKCVRDSKVELFCYCPS